MQWSWNRACATAAMALGLLALSNGALGVTLIDPQACDGVTRPGLITEVYCHTSTSHDDAKAKAVDWHPQIPPCDNCEDPAGPCLGQGLSFPDGEPAVVCFRWGILSMWTCCSMPGENGKKFDALCQCDELP